MTEMSKKYFKMKIKGKELLKIEALTFFSLLTLP